MALMTLMILLLVGTSLADTISVCQVGCNFSSIQTAIDASDPGDIIEVQSGIYHETLNITEQIILRGVDTGKGRPVIDAGITSAEMTNVEMTDAEMKHTEPTDARMMHAEMANGDLKRSAISVKAYGCVLEGFNIKNASQANGIYVTSSNNIIRDNIISNCQEGISLDKASYNIVTDNNISNNEEHGIYLYASIGNNIIDNNVSYCQEGISLVRSGRNMLKENVMSGNLQSFKVEEMFDNDIDISNLVDGKPVYYLVGSSGLVIDSSSNAGTVYCIDCRNITIKDLELKNNSYGLYLSGTVDSRIQNVSARDCGTGIMLFKSSRNILSGNHAIYGEEGIFLLWSNDNNVTGNSAAHDEDGIYLYQSLNNTLKNNTMSDNLNSFGVGGDFEGFDNNIDISNLIDGKPIHYMIGAFGSVIDSSSNASTVYCISCSNITIKDLALYNNTHGIFLLDTINSRIENNSITDCQTGILLFQSLNNTLQNNSITQNDHGIDLMQSGNNHLMNNALNKNIRSFRVEGYDQDNVLEDFDNRINISNLIDGKPIYYLVGASDQIINSSSMAGTVYCISCNNITVRDLELINNSYGIYFLDTDNSRIIDNKIEGNEDGIDLVWSNGNTIENNSIVHNEDGLDVLQSHDNQINYNMINYSRSGGGDGIYLGSSSNNKLMDNNISHNEAGISLYNSSRNTLKNNSLLENYYSFDLKVWTRKNFDNDIDTSNSIDGKPIYYLKDLSGMDINSSSNAGAVYCIGCANVTVRDLILNNSSHGVYLFDTSNSRIENITARNNRISIVLYYSHNNDIVGNRASHNLDGIDLWMSEQNNITGNKIDHNEDAGINLFQSDHNNLSSNEIVDSHNCILLWYSSDNNIVEANSLTGKHADGLSVTKSSDNLITGNMARESFNGIVLEDADSNIIADNEVTDNFNGHILINSSNNILRDNLAERNIYGFAVYLSGDDIVTGNNASNNLECGLIFELINNSSAKNNDIQANINGIVLNNSNRSAVSGNNVTANLLHGIRFFKTNCSQIDNNNVTGNKVGISVSNSSEDMIAGNTISRNYVGIYISNSRNISMAENLNYNNSFNELKNGLMLLQEALNETIPEIIAEPLSLILYSPTHGGYSGEIPAADISPEDNGPHPGPTSPTGGGSGGTGKLQPATPQPSDPFGAIDEALDELDVGEILYNPPLEMEVGKQERVEVRITRDITVNLSENLMGRGTPQIEKIRTGTYMKVRLSGSNFKIDSLSDEEQLVAGHEFTQWNWDVTPVEGGEQLLSIIVTVVIKLPDSSWKSKELGVFSKTIKVKVSSRRALSQFIRNNWQWMMATLIIPTAAWLIRSRKKKQS